jgi:transposase
MTYLHARPPRVNCPKHGIKRVRLPWADPKARFIAVFARFAIDGLHETDLLWATRFLRIIWDKAFQLPAPAARRRPWHGESKQEHRELQGQSDDTLFRSEYRWLHLEENLPEHSKARSEELRKADLKTDRAWSIEEALRQLWRHADREAGEARWKRWCFWAMHSRLAPMVTAVRTVERHVSNVLTYFERRIRSAVNEGLNSKIQTIKERAQGLASGFRNREVFRAAIYSHCGGLQLYPASANAAAHTIPG